MRTIKEHATLATLEARRQALLREVAEVLQQIAVAEQAQARLVERIKVLERGQRRAA